MKPFTQRLLILIGFLLPIGYVGVIIGVTSHELLGHGVTALLLGGRFEGFVVKPDGMGWAIAYAAPDAPAWHSVIIYAGGVTATVIVGSVLLIAGILIRRSLWLSASLFLLAGATLLDSAAYTFWSALYPGTLGDAAMIVELTGSKTTQVMLVGFGLILTLLATYVPYKLLLDISEAWLTPNDETGPGRRAIMIVVLFLTPIGGAYYAFDWNQLIDGVGYMPAHANLLLVSLIALVFWLHPRRWIYTDTHTARPYPSIAIAWLAGVATLLITLLWLNEGVTW